MLIPDVDTLTPSTLRLRGGRSSRVDGRHRSNRRSRHGSLHWNRCRCRRHGSCGRHRSRQGCRLRGCHGGGRRSPRGGGAAPRIRVHGHGRLLPPCALGRRGVGRILSLSLSLLRLLLPPAHVGGVLVADLALHPHVIRDVPRRVPEGGDEKLVPEGGAVNAVVEQADAHVGPVLDGASNLLDGLGIRLRTLQETAIPTEDLVECVASEVEEALGRVHDWIVGERRVCDDKVLLCCLKGLDEREVWVVQDLVSVAAGISYEASASGSSCCLSKILGFQKLVGLLWQVRSDRVA
mmetsp:Transcript_6595/g.19461  ORF Transcript_6595/g.19461 Transcript_6595/m.19461 type:complete len:293 (-) Transcript_6595:1266-2144(-)